MYKSLIISLFFYTLPVSAQVKTNVFLSQSGPYTKFESGFINNLNYVKKLNFESRKNKYSDKTQLCKKQKVVVDRKYLEDFDNCNNIEYAAGTYSIVHNKWYLFDLSLDICNDQETNLSMGSFTCLDLRDRHGELIDRLIVEKTMLLKPDTIDVNFCTTELGEVKILQTWKNKTTYERIKKINDKRARTREEFYPTLPRSCFKLLTYKVDSQTGKFMLQPEVETGTLLKDFRSIYFDQDSPLYKYR